MDTQDFYSNTPIIQETQNSAYNLYIKKIFDVMAAGVAIVFLSPLLLLISLLIRIDSHGCIIYKQKRVGRFGKSFYIYKFRTMVADADNLDKHFDPVQIQNFQENYKLKEDPRITRIGGFLRRTSLDELPQLINILKGDMSFVGPRPVVENELEKYGHHSSVFLSVRPGLTGLWQATGRSDTTYEQRVQMDLQYIRNLGFWHDIRIIFLTVVKVLLQEGAY